MIMLPIICQKQTGDVTSVMSVLHYGRDTEISTNWSNNPIKGFQTADTVADFWSMMHSSIFSYKLHGYCGETFH